MKKVLDEVLGKTVKDIVTDFVGIATAKIEYLTGCNQYEVKPKVDKDGKYQDSKWFDENHIAVVDEGVRKQMLESIKDKELGGPTPSDSMPTRD